MATDKLREIHQKCRENSIFINDEGGDPIPVPIALKPSVYDRRLFEKAMKSMTEFNLLLDKLSADLEFLELIETELEGSDEFMDRLFRVHKESFRSPYNGNIVAGLNRNDFLVSEGRLYQVELNTLSCSFMALSQKVSGVYREVHPEADIPENHSLDGTVELICAIHKLFLEEYHSSEDPVPEIAVLMLVQEKERNYWDQKHLIDEVERTGVRVLKRTFSEIHGSVSLSPDNGALELDGIEISCVYFRTGYVPGDYSPNEEECWKARTLIERSRAVKLPNVGYQLIGKKVVQRLLEKPSVFEHFSGGTFPGIPQYFARLYSCKDEKAVQMVLENPENFVLKPQRDGGGNNLYGQDIIRALDDPAINRSAYTLMEYIKSPVVYNSLARSRAVEKDVEVVCELGVYGGFLKHKGRIVVNKELGYLLRTKNRRSEESGIIAGFGYFDSPSFEQ